MEQNVIVRNRLNFNENLVHNKVRFQKLSMCSMGQMLLLCGRKVMFLLIFKVKKKIEIIINLGDNEPW